MTRFEREEELRIYLEGLYPSTSCFLHSDSEFGFLVAVILSAQAQDKVVNRITPILFKAYPGIDDMAEAKEEDVLNIIRPVGLGPSKARNIIALARVLLKDFNSKIPHERKVLETLPGIGHKTAGVFLGEEDGYQVIPVDTHISRISIRLGIAKKSDGPDQIEKILEKNYRGQDMMNFHREMILFGRNICLASSSRRCEVCPLRFCKERK